jgi:Flp pilus assembly protein TadD
MPFNKSLQPWAVLLACMTFAACSTTAPTTVVATAAKPEGVSPITRNEETTRPSGAAISPATAQSFEAGKRALEADRTQEAQRIFQALRQSNPELGGPPANLGLIYRQAGQLPEALAELEAAARLSPQQATVHNQLGITYRQLGQFDAARQAYEKAIALDANYAAAILNLGILCDLYLGDAARATDLYARYLALTPSDATVGKWLTELKNRKPVAAAMQKKESS